MKIINPSLLSGLRRYSIKMKLESTSNIVRNLDRDAEELAVGLIRNGRVIAVPTDTVYGLACDANSHVAVQQMYDIKGRDKAKPIAICVDELDRLAEWGQAEHLPRSLLTELLPGPVTVVLEQTPKLDNPFLNPGTDKIGIRIPDFGFVRNLAAEFCGPIALTSANVSSIPSSVSVEEFESLYSKLGAVFDGGILADGSPETRTGSTVVDLSEIGLYRIVRKGTGLERTVSVLERYKIFLV